MSETQKGMIGLLIFYGILFAVLLGVSVLVGNIPLLFAVQEILRMLLIPYIISGLSIFFALIWKDTK